MRERTSAARSGRRDNDARAVRQRARGSIGDTVKRWHFAIGVLVLVFYGGIIAALAIAYGWPVLVAGALLAAAGVVGLLLMK